MLTLAMLVIVLLFTSIVLVLSENQMVQFVPVFYIPLFWVSLALQAKRWYDRNRSAWWILINFISFGGIWVFIETCFFSVQKVRINMMLLKVKA